MRSRYAAYRGGLVDYIIETTDPNGEAYEHDLNSWRVQLEQHCRQTRYSQLQILDAPDADVDVDVGFVTFRVAFTQGESTDGFVERSEFRRVQGVWLYFRGQLGKSATGVA